MHKKSKFFLGKNKTKSLIGRTDFSSPIVIIDRWTWRCDGSEGESEPVRLSLRNLRFSFKNCQKKTKQNNGQRPRHATREGAVRGWFTWRKSRFFYSICISLLSFVVVFLLFCACFAFSGDSYHESPPEGKSDSTREKLLKSNVCFFGWNFLRNGWPCSWRSTTKWSAARAWTSFFSATPSNTSSK